MIGLWMMAIIEQGRHPSGDGPHVIGTANRLALLLIDGDMSFFVSAFSSLLGPHPPFAYLPFMTGKLIVPNAEWSHLLGGAIVLWICWDGIRRMGGGLIGFCWLMAVTPVWLQAENAGIDLWAGACVIQSLSHLAATKHMRNRFHIAMWGAWMGAAFMTKYTAPLFLWAPTLLAGWWVLKRGRWRALALSISGFCVVALPWWSTHANNVWGYIKHSGDGSTGLLTNQTLIDDPWGKIENVGWYPAAVADAVGWTTLIIIAIVLFVCMSGLNTFLRNAANASKFSILNCLGSAWLFHESLARNRMRTSTVYIAFLSVLGGWIVLNSQKQRQDRYILPAAPVAAAILGVTPLAWPALPYALSLFTKTKKFTHVTVQHRLNTTININWQITAYCNPVSFGNAPHKPVNPSTIWTTSGVKMDDGTKVHAQIILIGLFHWIQNAGV